jgi:hypothetical protein
MGRITGAIKDEFGAILNGVVSSFIWVIMLLRGFMLSIVDAEGAEYMLESMV